MAKHTINKSAFVRALGNIPAKDVVRKAKQRGFTLSIAHVYTIRSAMNRKAGGRSAGRVVRRGRPPKARTGSGLHASIDRIAAKFIDAILSAIRGVSLEDLLRR